MAVAVTAADLAGLLSIVTQHVHEDLHDQVFKGHKLLKHIPTAEASGAYEQVPVRALDTDVSEENAPANGQFSTATTANPFKSAKYEVENRIISPLVIDDLELIKTGSPEKLFDNLTKRMEGVVDDHKVKITDQLYAATATAGKMTPLKVAIDDTAVTGGLDPATDTAWASTVETWSIATDGSIVDFFESMFDGVFDALNEEDTLGQLLVAKDVYNRLRAWFRESSNTTMNFDGGQLTRDAGTGNLYFNEVPVERDGRMTAGDVLAFPKEMDKSLVIYTHEWMKQREPKEVQAINGGNVDATLNEAIPFVSTAELVTLHRRALARGTVSA